MAGRRCRSFATVACLALVAALASPLTPAGAAGRSVHVIVRGTPGDQARILADLRALGSTGIQPLAVLDGASATVPSAGLAILRTDPDVGQVTTDGPVHLLTDSTTPYDPHHDPDSLFNLEQMIGARGMWNKWTGAGVDVALLDSGVTPVEGLSGSGQLLNGPDLTEESQSPATNHLDTYGHGTFMAGIIAGRDPGIVPAQNQGNATPFLGVAPGARIVSVKVADAHGMTDVTQVIAGIDWVVQHAHDPGMNIRVLNLSFGTQSTDSYLADPLDYAAEVAWKAGIVVVASAGNTGSAGLTDPANDPYLIAVGADDMNGTPAPGDDRIASFSSTGNGSRNPDLVAPGVHVQSLTVPGSYVDDADASTGTITPRFFRGSGTSEAAAVVSGAVALLAQEYPNDTPDQLKYLLTSTSLAIPKVPAAQQGAGLINLRGASAPAPTGSGQHFASAAGTGTLDAARGGSALVLDGVALTGSEDINGATVDTAALAQAESNHAAWNGGTFDGAAWAGSSWSGTSWSSCAWAGTSWSGSSWSGTSWSTGQWDGSTWSGTSWSGTSWSGATWSSATWSGSTYASSSWSDSLWATDSWS